MKQPIRRWLAWAVDQTVRDLHAEKAELEDTLSAQTIQHAAELAEIEKQMRGCIGREVDAQTEIGKLNLDLLAAQRAAVLAEQARSRAVLQNSKAPLAAVHRIDIRDDAHLTRLGDGQGDR